MNAQNKQIFISLLLIACSAERQDQGMTNIGNDPKAASETTYNNGQIETSLLRNSDVKSQLTISSFDLQLQTSGSSSTLLGTLKVPAQADYIRVQSCVSDTCEEYVSLNDTFSLPLLSIATYEVSAQACVYSAHTEAFKEYCGDAVKKSIAGTQTTSDATSLKTVSSTLSKDYYKYRYNLSIFYFLRSLNRCDYKVEDTTTNTTLTILSKSFLEKSNTDFSNAKTSTLMMVSDSIVTLMDTWNAKEDKTYESCAYKIITDQKTKELKEYLSL